MKYIQEKREYYSARDSKIIIRAKRNPYNLPDPRCPTKTLIELFRRERNWKSQRINQYK